MRIGFCSRIWIGRVSLPLLTSAALTNLAAELDGEIVTFRARIHTLRRMSAKLVFIVFRQQTITIQGVLQSFKARHELAGMCGGLVLRIGANPF